LDDLRPLPPSFFDRPAEVVARQLLGKVLVTSFDDTVTGGRIVETEAYLGADDPGSHAATKGITGRNRVMYGPPSRAYVYFTYGNHHMLNLVTCGEGTAGAVLIRAIEPLAGIEMMTRRRKGRPVAELTNGPGKVAQALGVDLRHNGTVLPGEIVIADASDVPDGDVGVSGRIGLGAGHELPLRFYVQGSTYVSKGRIGPKPPRRRP
jgi:DNA-3-methyladenine glycosylase